MRTVCKNNECTGCMACVAACPTDAIKIEDNIDFYNAIVDEGRCVNCGLCTHLCQKNDIIELKKPFSWYQGWAASPFVRKNSSSGGLAAAIEKAFVKDGGHVCSCVFQEGGFVFEFADNEEGISRFIGSKYVKSNPAGVYQKVKELLFKGEDVLFVGLPCQVAGVKKYTDTIDQKHLYTIDLICHGTPSPRILAAYLKQHDFDINKISNIKFRLDNLYQITCDEQVFSVRGTCDCYTTAFLNSICYTENCYSCEYAKLERVSDLTLGDSWGSDLEGEVRKGISLVLCQSDKGERLLSHAELVLKDVDIEKAVSMNGQLRGPSHKPKGRDYFMRSVKTGKNFDMVITKCYPWIRFKQFVKGILLKTGIIRLRGGNGFQIVVGIEK